MTSVSSVMQSGTKSFISTAQGMAQARGAQLKNTPTQTLLLHFVGGGQVEIPASYLPQLLEAKQSGANTLFEYQAPVVVGNNEIFQKTGGLWTGSIVGYEIINLVSIDGQPQQPSR